MNAGCEIEARLERINTRWLQRARRGDFHGAWLASDEALTVRSGLDCSRWPRHFQFIWRGQDLRDKRVLVRCYHGLGDTIQFARFLPRVCAIASEVTLWAQRPLIPLLKTLRGGPARILPLHDGAPEVEFDVDLELFEVMHALRVPLEDVTVPVPYFHVERAEASARAREGRVRVGLVWRSGDWDDSRSIPCELLAPLRGVSAVEWLLFQRGPGLADWPHRYGTAPAMSDILSEAREMQTLDLLITVDTCSAHLAGALGVPVWTLLPHAADWRWMSGRSDSPWYPTMRLIRQRVPGDWSNVISEVMMRIEKLT